MELPNGTVRHYDGERGAERLMRVELTTDGTVRHFDGERGSEHLVRVEWADGTVGFYEGERGAERLVRTERPDVAAVHTDAELCDLADERRVRSRETCGAAGARE